MIVFPVIALLLSAACAAAIARDALIRPRPDKVAWAIAFGLFALGAGAEVAGSLAGWNELLVRLYYVSGAVLVVGFLALGELYLLAPRRMERIGPGIALLATAVAVTIVWSAPIDAARIATDGWDAIERGPALIALAITINSVGTLVIVGGLAWSSWGFRRRELRNRMIGCLLIAAGTLTVAMGGTLTRLGAHEYLYIAMSAGVAIIFAGYLWTKRPDRQETASTSPAAAPVAAPALVALPAARGRGAGRVGEVAGEPAIAFLEERFLPLADAELAEACRRWSVPRRDDDALSRDDARRVWALRLRLSAPGQALLDAHTVPAQRQIAELYHDVLTAAESVAQGS